MAAAAHNPSFAKKVGVPVTVAKEFNAADKGRKFSRGGEMVNKLFKGKETPAEEKKEAKALKAGKISPKQYVAGEKKEGHGAGAAKKAAAIKSGKLSPKAYASEHAMKKGGSCKGYAAGGLTAGHKSADGIAKRGKTKGTAVAMKRGGKCCK